MTVSVISSNSNYITIYYFCEDTKHHYTMIIYDYPGVLNIEKVYVRFAAGFIRL